MTGFVHKTVLLNETVNALVYPEYHAKDSAMCNVLPVANKTGTFVDGTFGRGGHSRALLRHLAADARLIVFDKDPEAIQSANELALEDKRVTVIHDAFSSMQEHLSAMGITNIQGVMLDLGISSPQIDDASRGFSFMKDGPLDMRMDSSRGMTAAQWLHEASVEEIKEVIKNYGEERYAFQIAKTIDRRRQEQPIRTTLELAELISSCVRTREKGQHPATRTFQAIRIFLNEELQELSRSLTSILTLLDTQARMAIISFHSLEDRMVKQFISAASKPGAAYSRLPLRESEMPQATLLDLGKRKPSEKEVEENPRSRSAILRVAQRTGVTR
ncbi:16S rRNA (cytosine(1402)-N(4))-methyltransferase RsmH [Basilea psittacipulmonis]|uniref:Ribosomal RNA small subunit methyltransferase H n=1 Tax=Basilea psittacipulmonis DSM 24701 TaxID=1072685 RepID=A0A077DGN5_9BURK|nr:16S rRNA (cytosine(1402)-N(4))-methyltransferase RsmH [Basilea psittacipulmonis]AIL32313.1 16S rRNA methyltransferase [Basilea psittacipulmonis DSM 24701]